LALLSLPTKYGVEINGREEEESLGGRRGSHIFYPFKL
jgi:hypothetical protein